MVRCADYSCAQAADLSRHLRIIPDSMDGRGKVESWAERGKGCTGESNKVYYQETAIFTKIS